MGLNFFQVLFTTTSFSSVLSCEDLPISSLHRSANMWIFIYLNINSNSNINRANLITAPLRACLTLSSSGSSAPQGITSASVYLVSLDHKLRNGKHHCFFSFHNVIHHTVHQKHHNSCSNWSFLTTETLQILLLKPWTILNKCLSNWYIMYMSKGTTTV